MVGIVCRECGNDGRLSRWERKNGTWGCPSCGFINRFDPEAFVSSRRAWMGNVGKAGLAMLGGITGSVSTYLLSRPTRTYSFVGSGGVKFSGGLETKIVPGVARIVTATYAPTILIEPVSPATARPCMAKLSIPERRELWKNHVSPHRHDPTAGLQRWLIKQFPFASDEWRSGWLA